MSDSKISALPSATTPLAGTEVLPIVQDGATVNASVANFTAGRTVAMLGATLNGAAAAPVIDLSSDSLSSEKGRITNNIAGNIGLILNTDYYDIELSPAVIGGGKSVKLMSSNLVVNTAAKGINFTANTPAAGMTSQLLNWYEEGTWTPNQGAGLTVVGAFSSNGTYTRVGRSITVKGQVLGATTVAVAAAGVVSTNLPFSAASGHAGSMFNAAATASGVVAITTSTVTAATAITATASITFTATYQI